MVLLIYGVLYLAFDIFSVSSSTREEKKKTKQITTQRVKAATLYFLPTSPPAPLPDAITDLASSPDWKQASLRHQATSPLPLHSSDRATALRKRDVPVFLLLCQGNCDGRKTTEQTKVHLYKIAHEWNNWPFFIHEPVNSIIYIKHCAKVLNSKRYYKMEHLNIHISHIPLEKRKKKKAEEWNKIICTEKWTTYALHLLEWCVWGYFFV